MCVATAIGLRAQIFTTLHNFNMTDGSVPGGGLLPGSDGNFYGTTAASGPSGFGTMFKITPRGELTTLHRFDGTDGSAPQGLVQASNGEFYGTTQAGGANGFGTVFKISPGVF